MGKSPKSPFSGIGERAKGILELKHYDVCGMMAVSISSLLLLISLGLDGYTDNMHL